MNRLLIVVILIIGTLPLYGQGQQLNTAELAQKVVGIIAGDKTKTQTYCQVLDLSDELDQVDQQKDRKKAEDLSQKINELQKNLGPEYLALQVAGKTTAGNAHESFSANSMSPYRIPTEGAERRRYRIENDYDKEVYNGDIGTIDNVDPDAGELAVSFDSRSVK